jgi:hypothetical protein
LRGQLIRSTHDDPFNPLALRLSEDFRRVFLNVGVG